VGEKMLQGNPGIGELRDVFFQQVIIVEFSFLGEHHDDHRGELFRHGCQFENGGGIEGSLRIQVDVSDGPVIDRFTLISDQHHAVEPGVGREQRVKLGGERGSFLAGRARLSQNDEEEEVADDGHG